jgi:sugar/nucleoside kinase (ribokinase family)
MADLTAAPAGRLFVFGGISLDTMVRVQALPRPDDKIWAEHLGDFPGGMGANVAANYAHLGGHAHLFGAVGDDESGRYCLDVLASAGVDTSGVRRRPGATFKTFAMVGPDGEKAMVLLAGTYPPAPGDMPALDPQPGRDAVHIAPGPSAPPVGQVQDWRRRGIRTSIDIEPAMLNAGLAVQDWLAASSLVFCGAQAAGMIGSAADPHAALMTGGADAAVITRGRDGAGLATRDGRAFTAPGLPTDAVDTTGAGDAFAGAFLWGLSRGWSLDDCLGLANRVGGNTAGVFGSRLSRERISAIRDDFHPAGSTPRSPAAVVSGAAPTSVTTSSVTPTSAKRAMPFTTPSRSPASE